MLYEEWWDKYKPIKNHIDDNSCFDHYAFETYGEEVNYIINKIDTKCIWTLIEADGEWYIIPGYHLVNRLLYFYTEIPWEDENLEIKIDR